MSITCLLYKYANGICIYGAFRKRAAEKRGGGDILAGAVKFLQE